MVLPVADPVAEAFGRALGHVAASGTWLTSGERLDAVGQARAALAGGDGDGSVRSEVIQAVAQAPEFITQDWIEDLIRRGLPVLEYVEIVGLVARTAALETAAIGLGIEPPELPDPHDGEPSMRRNVEAEMTTAFVPIAGRPGATTALNAVLAECEAQEDLSNALYLTYRAMDEPDQVVRGLHRRQIELVAARTSYLNDCYY